MAIDNCNRNIFDDELRMIEESKKFMDQEQHNPFLQQYADLLATYERLLNIAKKSFVISDLQGKALVRRENELKNLLDNANQGFLTFGSNLLVHPLYSAECTRILNRKKVKGLNILDLLFGNDSELKNRTRRLFHAIFSSDNSSTTQECLDQLSQTANIHDKHIHMECKVITQFNGEQAEEVIMLILTDVTERLRSQSKVDYLIYHDPLTSLFNRAYLDQMIVQYSSSDRLPLSVVMVDMNGLKLTNDVFGHEQGDRLIMNTADILRQCCRHSDLICRWGGDEFVILLPNTDSLVCHEIIHRIHLAFTQSAKNPIQISAAIGAATSETDKADFYRLLNQAENVMYKQKHLERKAFRSRMIDEMQSMLLTRAFENEGHTERVEAMAVKFAQLLGIDTQLTETKNLSLLACLHDVGKVAVPKAILANTKPLLPQEWDILKEHSEIGCRMAQSLGEAAVADAIYALRERWDGTGYPNGLKGDQIPFLARMLAVVEAFDVMTHDCIYKEAVSTEDAMKEISNQSGLQFDPQLTAIFLEHIDFISASDEAQNCR